MVFKTMEDVAEYLFKIFDSVGGVKIIDISRILDDAGSRLGKNAVVGITYKARTNRIYSSLDVLVKIGITDGGYTVTSCKA